MTTLDTMTDKILAKIREILTKRGISPGRVNNLANEAWLGHELWEEAEHELMGEDYAKEHPDLLTKPETEGA